MPDSTNDKLHEKEFNASEQKEIKVISLENKLRNHFETLIPPRYKFNKTDVKLPRQPTSSVIKPEIEKNYQELKRILSFEDQDRVEALRKEINLWKTQHEAIDVTAILRLTDDEIDQLATITDSLVEKDSFLKKVPDSFTEKVDLILSPISSKEEALQIASGYTEDEIQQDSDSLDDLATLHTLDTLSDKELVKELRKLLDQWASADKFQINMKAIRGLWLQDRLVILNGFSRAALSDVEDFSRVPSEKDLPPFPIAKRSQLPEPPPKNLDRGTKLGEGENGEVYSARKPQSKSNEYAIKTPFYGKSAMRDFQNEQHLYEALKQALPKDIGILPFSFGLNNISFNMDQDDSDDEIEALVIELIKGFDLSKLTKIIAVQEARKDLSVEDRNIVAWQIAVKLIFAMIELAKYGFDHGDLTPRNIMFEKSTAMLRLLDPARSKLWDIPPHILLKRENPSNQLEEIYPGDLVRIINSVSYFISKLLPNTPIPDLRTEVWRQGGREFFDSQEDKRTAELSLIVLQSLHIKLDLDDVQKLNILPGHTVDSMREEITKKLPHVDLDSQLPSVDEQSYEKELKENISKLEEKIAQCNTNLIAQLNKLPDTSFNRLAKSVYKIYLQSSSDVRDFEFLIDMPYDPKIAARIIKKIYAMDTLHTHTSEDGESVFQQIVKQTMQAHHNDAVNTDDIVESAISVLRSNVEDSDSDFDQEVYRESIEDVARRTQTLHNRLYSSFTYITRPEPEFISQNDSYAANWETAKILGRIAKDTKDGQEEFLDLDDLTDDILDALDLKYVFATNKDGFIYYDYDKQKKSPKKVDHPTYEFSRQVVMQFCLQLRDLVQQLKANVEKNSQLEENVDKLVISLSLDDKNIKPSSDEEDHIDLTLPQNVFKKAVAVHLNWGGNTSQNTPDIFDRNHLDSTELQLNATRRNEDDRFEKEGHQRLSSYQLPPLQSRRNIRLQNFQEAMDLSLLMHESAVERYIDEPHLLEKDEAELLASRTTLISEMNGYLKTIPLKGPLSEGESFLLDLTHGLEDSSSLNKGSLEALQSNLKEAEKKLYDLYSQYQDLISEHVINESAEEQQDKKRKEVASLVLSRKAIRYCITYINRIKDITYSLVTIIEAKELSSNTELHQQFKRDIAHKRHSLKRKTDYAADIDKLWQEAVVENHLIQWVANNDRLAKARQSLMESASRQIQFLNEQYESLAEKSPPSEQLEFQVQLHSELMPSQMLQPENQKKQKELMMAVREIESSIFGLENTQHPTQVLNELLAKTNLADKLSEEINIQSQFPLAAFHTLAKLIKQSSLPLINEDRLIDLESESVSTDMLLTKYEDTLKLLSQEVDQNGALDSQASELDQKLTERRSSYIIVNEAFKHRATLFNTITDVFYRKNNEDIEQYIRNLPSFGKSQNTDHQDEVSSAIKLFGMRQLQPMWEGLLKELEYCDAYKAIYPDSRPDTKKQQLAKWNDHLHHFKNALSPLIQQERETIINYKDRLQAVNSCITNESTTRLRLCRLHHWLLKEDLTLRSLQQRLAELKHLEGDSKLIKAQQQLKTLSAELKAKLELFAKETVGNKEVESLGKYKLDYYPSQNRSLIAVLELEKRHAVLSEKQLNEVERHNDELVKEITELVSYPGYKPLAKKEFYISSNFRNDTIRRLFDQNVPRSYISFGSVGTADIHRRLRERYLVQQGGTPVTSAPSDPIASLSNVVTDISADPGLNHPIMQTRLGQFSKLPFHWLPDGKDWHIPENSVVGYMPSNGPGEPIASYFIHDMEENQIIRVPVNRLGHRGCKELDEALSKTSAEIPKGKHPRLLCLPHGYSLSEKIGQLEKQDKKSKTR